VRVCFNNNKKGLKKSMWQPGITLEQIEREVILKALRFYQGNKTQTARALGVAVRTIDNKLECYKGSDHGTDALQTNKRVSVEPAAEAPQKPSMSVRKR
jgi:Bacterial regulatory protein, Fis family